MAAPRLAIPLFDGCFGFSVTTMARVAQLATLYTADGTGRNEPIVEVAFVGDMSKPVMSEEGLPISATSPFDDTLYDCVYVPQMGCPPVSRLLSILEESSQVQAWLRRQMEGGAAIAAGDSSIFMLAEAGLLDGRTAVAPPWLRRAFEERYPRVRIEPLQALVEGEQLIMASKGASTTGLHLRVVARLAGRDAAQKIKEGIAGMLGQPENSRIALLYFDSFEREPVFEKSINWMRLHLREHVTLADIARAAMVTERTLDRKFKTASGLSPLVFLQNMRLDLAHTMLRRTAISIKQVAEQCGYPDYNNFYRAFRQKFGVSPGQLRECSAVDTARGPRGRSPDPLPLTPASRSP